MFNRNDQYSIINESIYDAEWKFLERALTMPAVSTHGLNWIRDNLHECRVHGYGESHGRLHTALGVPIERFVEITASAG